MAKWNFRIVEIEYDDGTKKYGVQTDRGEGDEWNTIYRSTELSEARKIKAEREAKNSTAELVVVE